MCQSNYAAHIIGGEITYECLGGDNYRFTMIVYRDCNGGGACFDSQLSGCNSGATLDGTVTVFIGTNQFTTITLDNPDVNPILPNLSNPCLTAPPNVCVEEGVYEFDLNLPASNQSYTITYQRCCRNNSITNIVAPGQTGATYTIELTPEAQSTCNNSPVFNDFPPIVICNGIDINFDHSATDAEGDSLVYSFCSPLTGGGSDTQNWWLPTGVAPDPDSPPPYNNVVFGPLYSSGNPMGGSPQVIINPQTGLISGVPIALGQFVVGVCVREYRNGVLLSTVFRDFQFNVGNCTPTVNADIEETELLQINDQEVYYVRACGEANIDINNESTIISNISSQQWVFNLPGGGTLVSTDFDATGLTFPGEGLYNGFLELNPGLPCNDTALIQVEIFPAVNADFEFQYDTCVSGPTFFSDLSTSNAGPNTVVDWIWNFGDGNTSTDQNPEHLYMIPGELPVSLTAIDINGCDDTDVQVISYFPVPEEIVIAPSDFLGCQPAEIFFNNLSFPIDDTYTIEWNFGDGGTSSEISPTHVYNDLGTFTVDLNLISPIGCQTDTTWEDLITILASPIADFSFTPEEVTNLEPFVQFTDQSIDAIKWKWDFGGVGSSLDPSPSFMFQDTGLHVIELVVWHESGCTDTAFALIDVIPEVKYFLPNAFTPNGDGKNDLYYGNGVMEGATAFNFTIWNRYGEKIFETGDPFEGWNGRKNNTGKMSPNGVYIAIATFKSPRGELIQLKSFATLIR